MIIMMKRMHFQCGSKLIRRSNFLFIIVSRLTRYSFICIFLRCFLLFHFDGRKVSCSFISFKRLFTRFTTLFLFCHLIWFELQVFIFSSFVPMSIWLKIKKHTCANFIRKLNYRRRYSNLFL